ncbi:MAG: hypothetical protein ACKOU7_08990 [Ferruginibacter sp.]
MKCALAFLYSLCTLLLPAHASASVVDYANKIKPGYVCKPAFHKIFVEEKKYNDNPRVDYDDLDNDDTDGEVLDNDDCNNENNNESSGKRRININFFQESNFQFKESIHAKTGKITTSEHHIVPAGAPIIIFIRQFRL